MVTRNLKFPNFCHLSPLWAFWIVSRLTINHRH